MTKIHPAPIISALLLMCTLASAAERGRVRMTPESVVADNGTLLRTNCTHMNNNAKSKSYWQGMRDTYGYNGMRVMAYIGPWWQSGASKREPLDPSAMANVYAHLDAAANAAAELGMYLIIEDHSGKINDYNKEDNRTFWKGVAPRYKGRTHVVYEIKNEPVGGEGTMEQKYARKPDEVPFQVEMYKLIRGLAPNTHIICWSFCEGRRGMLPVVKQGEGIDYSNASVGFHPYVVDMDWGGVRELIDSGFPAVNTELGYIPAADFAGIVNLPGYFSNEIDKIRHSITMGEKLKVSWMMLGHLSPAKTLYGEKLWTADDGKVLTVEPIHSKREGIGSAAPVSRTSLLLSGPGTHASGTDAMTFDGRRIGRFSEQAVKAVAGTEVLPK